MSTSSEPQMNATQIRKMRQKFSQFRILVIGRANAGKTTILRRVCNTTGEPMIFSPNGEKIESSALNPSLKRGLHDIENEMIFESNPGFIFHDSRGFEAGAAQELKLVQEFIEQRSKARKAIDQLHAIWYCIPTSDDRPITAAEKKFFNECGTGLVPVIVLWTKTDSLDVAKFMQLMKQGNSRSKAMERAPQEAWADFERDIYQRFDVFKYKPKAYVVFRKMHEPGADCNDLIKKTTAALSSEELQQLFVSTQQNNIELCVTYGIKRILNSAESALAKSFKKYKGDWAYCVTIVLAHFPHLIIHGWDKIKVDGLEKESVEVFLWGRYAYYEDHTKNSISKIMSSILSRLSPTFSLKEAVYCAIVAAIVGHLSFFLHQQSPTKNESLERAAQIYQQSLGCDTSVKQAIDSIFQLENLVEGSHHNHGFLNLFKQCQVNHELLAGEAVQVALDNLLSKK